MITTLTLNPCIDRTITIEKFLFGGTNKVLDVRKDVSGKGINVSIVLKHLGLDTLCLGFNYSKDSKAIEEELNDQNIKYDFVKVKGEVRVNVKIFDKSVKVMSEFNESGHQVSKEAVDELLDVVYGYFDDTSILVLDGSVPAGVPVDIYKTIIEMANRRGIKTILDAANDLLLEGIKAKPYMIKPNIDELSAISKREIKTREDIISVSREIISKGVSYVCVSMGKDGAMLIGLDNVYVSPAMKVDIKGIQGAGDSLVAGICMAIDKGISEEKLLAYGVAAASGSLLHEGTLLCEKEDFDRLLPEVVVNRL